MNRTSTYPSASPRNFSIDSTQSTPNVSPVPRTRRFVEPTSVDNYRKYREAKQQQPILRIPRDRTDEVVTASLGIGTTAAAFAPVIAPAVAAAGIGYGVYKLGASFDLW